VICDRTFYARRLGQKTLIIPGRALQDSTGCFKTRPDITNLGRMLKIRQSFTTLGRGKGSFNCSRKGSWSSDHCSRYRKWNNLFYKQT